MASTWTNAKLLDELIASGDAAITLAFTEMVLAMQAEGTLASLAELLSAGDFETALQSLEAHVAKFSTASSRIYINAGQETIDSLGDTLGIIVNFDQTNARAVRLIQQNRLELIRQFTEGQRQATRRALLDGIERGLNPRAQARVFRDSIGLTDKQVGWISNYRRELEGLDSRALTRQLRDGRFDRTVRRAIADDSPLSKSQIDKMVGRYRERWIKFRAETIARTESLEAVHAGSNEAIQQAVDSGAVEATKATGEWQTALDERVRDPQSGSQTSHRTMHGQIQTFGDPFISGAGNELQYPGDRNAPPYETILCRCRAATRISL